MNITIRPMRADDKEEVLSMMRVFYASPAVHSNGSEEIFSADIVNCVNDNPFLEGYIVEDEGITKGYAMIARSFSTEFGKSCIWIEDLYIKDDLRGFGVGKTVLDFITSRYTDCIFRLEVEKDNERAVRLYTKCGFTALPYMEMKKQTSTE